MKKLIFFLLPFFALCAFHLNGFSQKAKALSWFGELHGGFQSTLNDQTYSAQIRSGYVEKGYDSSEHYSAYFNNQVPIEIAVGFQNKKGLRILFSGSYYQIKMALSNPPQVTGYQEYQFGKAAIFTFKSAAYLDYSAIDALANEKSKVHFMTGFSTGLIIPVSTQLNEATATHFGIASFDRRIVWTAGIELLLNIDISKRLYIANALGLSFPISGSLGQLQMQNNAAYTAGKPVKPDELKISTGMGIRF
ncbi:MAG: hypothetical protein JST58_08340 [Bacteroidetes bacterium]|nr:hypothetical protein [Bacteroidota bacterium]